MEYEVDRVGLAVIENVRCVCIEDLEVVLILLFYGWLLGQRVDYSVYLFEKCTGRLAICYAYLFEKLQMAKKSSGLGVFVR